MSRTTARVRRVVVIAKGGLRTGWEHLRPARAAVVKAGRRLPAPVRRGVSTVVLRRPWSTEVPIDSLLLGSQVGLTADEYAEATGDLLWASTRVSDGPHAALFRAALAKPEGLTDDEILTSPYASMARTAIAVRQHYFGATDDAGIVDLARSAIARYVGDGVDAGTDVRPVMSSAPTDPILVAPVRGSRMFQVLDGHHRVAAAAVAGATTAQVVAKWFPVETPLQRLLLRMSWIGGKRQLYQPVEAPELDRWPLVRKCTDRRDKMVKFLADEGVVGAEGSALGYLDVASCYGWFVDQMEANGLTARGIERDPLGPVLGHAVYGLDPSKIATGDAIELLDAMGEERVDVVSCFSLLHHFVLGRGSVSAEELIKRLDDHTARVLFMDTGQANEEWFRESLPEWTAEYVRTFLETNTDFRRIVDLGPDDDAVAPYEKNYARHLFACVR